MARAVDSSPSRARRHREPGGRRPPGPGGPEGARRDPWRRSPTSELQDQVLPRWFVLLAVVLVPVALGVVLTALFAFGPEDVPVQARRPPPAGGLSHAVGEFAVGSAAPTTVDAEDCPLLSGLRVAGQAADRQRLRTGLSAVCQADLEPSARARVRRFAAAGGVVRFAQFEATGVDSAVVLDADEAQPVAGGADLAGPGDGGAPTVLVNARFSQTEPRWIAPLLVHDLTLLELGPGQAHAAVAARRAELQACSALFAGERASRACDDARELLQLPDPQAALRGEGYA